MGGVLGLVESHEAGKFLADRFAWERAAAVSVWNIEPILGNKRINDETKRKGERVTHLPSSTGNIKRR